MFSRGYISSCHASNSSAYRQEGYPTMGFPALVFLLLLMFNGLGCDQPFKERSTLESSGNSVEEDLEWAMDRLQRALDLQASGGAGLRIKREMKYEYHPPADEQSLARATVTIETTSAFLHKRNTKPPKKETRPLGYFDKDDPLNELDPNATSAEREEYEASQWLVSEDDKIMKKADLTVQASIPPRKKKETKKFQLVYKEDRWQLVTTPEGEYEQGLFTYALGE